MWKDINENTNELHQPARTVRRQDRISFDGAYNPHNVPRVKLDPWMMQVPCHGRGVTIYPYGANTLAVEVDRRPSIAAKLKTIEGLKLHQDGDVEKTFLFNVALFEQARAAARCSSSCSPRAAQLAPGVRAGLPLD